MRIASVGRAFPLHYYNQSELLAGLTALWGHKFHNPARLEQLHKNVLVKGRHLALPMHCYPELKSFTDSNRIFVREAVTLGERAITDALQHLDITPNRINHLFFVSVTGVATPSIDARLVNRMNLHPHIKRVPIFGLGCVAGAAGVARVADTLRGHPDDVAVLLSVELCSLTLQREDISIANLISSGLFGDGAAAVVMVGANHAAARGPRVVDTRSVFYRDTEQVMGWDIGSDGFKVVLSADVPRMVQNNIRQDVDTFLAEHQLTRRDISRWICHSGGPKVLEAFQEALEVSATALARTWRSLEEVGNLSSASVLMVLGDTLRDDPPPPGAYGLMVAMGPGFCSELVLLQW